MAVETGYSKTITSGSVFLYDTGDTYNSYKGEPITNQFQVQGTSGLGAAADNAVNFSVQGTVGFVRLGFGQTFGGYTIQQNDVVYKYPFNVAIGGCHYHGNTASIPAGAYLTFTFDYYISPDTNFATGNSTFLANVENYGGGALGGGVNMPNYLKDVWQTVTFTVGPRGGGTGTQAMFLYPGGCGGNIATNGFILFRNPRVYWLPYDVPFVQGTRSTTQAMIDIVGGNTVDLVNMTYGANNAISFDGTDDRIRVSQNNSFYVNNWTWEVVTRFTGNTGNYQGLVWAEGDTGGGSGLQYLLTLYNNQYFHYRINNTSTGWNDTNTSTITYTPTNYNHIVWQFNNGTTNIYVNGVLFHTDASRGSYSGGTNSPMFLGSRNDGAYTAPMIAPVYKYYNRALSASEVLSNFNHYKTRFNIT